MRGLIPALITQSRPIAGTTNRCAATFKRMNMFFTKGTLFDPSPENQAAFIIS
jgi:hypothetical protein